MSARFRAGLSQSASPRPRQRPPRDKAQETVHADGDSQRLQKILASAGVGSRRQCEALIAAGRVSVGGKVVEKLGTKIDPSVLDIRVDDEPIQRRTKPAYYVLNKPIGVVSTNFDPAGRPRVVDLIGTDARLFAVGRLDLTSEGLILLTNDGELANRLAHPRYGIEKIYHVQVVGVPAPEVLERLRRGVHLAEGFAHAKRVAIKSKHKQSCTLEMVLDEGRNREVRRLLAKVGHKVVHLKRVAMGPLRLGTLAVGESRPLRKDEILALKQSVGQAAIDARAATAAAIASSAAKIPSAPPHAPEPAPQPVTQRVPQHPLHRQAERRPRFNDTSRHEGSSRTEGSARPGGTARPGKAYTGKPLAGKPRTGKPRDGKPRDGKLGAGKPSTGKPRPGKPRPAAPRTEGGRAGARAGGGRPAGPRPGGGRRTFKSGPRGRRDRGTQS